MIEYPIVIAHAVDASVVMGDEGIARDELTLAGVAAEAVDVILFVVPDLHHQLALDQAHLALRTLGREQAAK